MIISRIAGADKAARIVRDAGGKVVGRTRLQKIAYLLEITDLGEGFLFEYRHYGPFSEQLADAVSAAEIVGLLVEEEHQAGWGGSYSVFLTKRDIEGASRRERLDLIRLAEEADPIALELAATAAFFAVAGEVSPWEETQRRKPEKAAKGLENAKDLYTRLQALTTPVQLPKILK